MSREQRASEIQAAIRTVLFREWDPIGVNNNPLLVDEYDSYIPSLYRILSGSRSAEELVNVLAEVERRLGMPSHSASELRSVAASLLTLNVKL